MFVLYCMARCLRSNKALLPEPKAPANKILKYNSFTLITAMDYVACGRK